MGDVNLQAIYIPTLGRLDKQITWDGLPEKWKTITHLVVRPHEFEEAKKICPQAVCLPSTVTTIAETRRWIVEYAESTRYAMIDDDMTFWRRHCDRATLKKSGDKSNTPFTEADYDELLGEVVPRWFNDGVVVGGIHPKGKPPADTDELRFARITGVFFINGELLPKELDWSVTYAEDIHFILQVLKSGKKTRCSDVFLQHSVYWSPGGCSQAGRTPDADKRSLQRLVDLHPDVVKFGETYIVNTGAFKDNPFENRRIKVSWKKAYETSEVRWNAFI
jgi:hypothetical protein